MYEVDFENSVKDSIEDRMTPDKAKLYLDMIQVGPDYMQSDETDAWERIAAHFVSLVESDIILLYGVDMPRVMNPVISFGWLSHPAHTVCTIRQSRFDSADLKYLLEKINRVKND